MNRNNEVNDLDFILFSLWEKDPEYKAFWLKNRKENPDRIVIFDNSAYEFFNNGQQFNVQDFTAAVQELNPTYFIVPDVLMNKDTTLENFKFFKNILKSYKRMVVPQGRSFKDWLECYKEMIEIGGFDMIGIPFHNDFFYDMGLAATMTEANNSCRTGMGVRYADNDSDFFYAFGRIILLQYLQDHGLVRDDIKYHLLGTHHWNEMKSLGVYHKYKFIYSADTSYPVTRGLVLKELECWDPKEKISIEEFFKQEIGEKEEEMILKNIQKFHSYVEVQKD